MGIEVKDDGTTEFTGTGKKINTGPTGNKTIEPEISAKDAIRENAELFKRCRSLANSLNLPDCSMGMSGDWEEAIDAGSTWVRLGSLIFGRRS